MSGTEQSVGATASIEDLALASLALDIPMTVLRDDRVVIANQAVAELTGIPAERLVGMSMSALLQGGRPNYATDLESGMIDSVRAELRVEAPGREPVQIWTWARAIDLDGHRAVVSISVPIDEIGKLGTDPVVPWRVLAAVSLGVADADWHIERISPDIETIIGVPPADLIGSSLLDLIDRGAVASRGKARAIPRVALPNRLAVRHADGGWVDVALIYAPQDTAVFFALIGPFKATSPKEDRVAELEMRLRRIGAEVHAARLLDSMRSVSTAHDLALFELTSRELDVVTRLLRAERVSRIASDLHISPRTVRNNLVSIYRKLGVHSQAELIEVFRPRE